MEALIAVLLFFLLLVLIANFILFFVLFSRINEYLSSGMYVFIMCFVLITLGLCSMLSILLSALFGLLILYPIAKIINNQNTYQKDKKETPVQKTKGRNTEW